MNDHDFQAGDVVYLKGYVLEQVKPLVVREIENNLIKCNYMDSNGQYLFAAFLSEQLVKVEQ